MAKDTDNRVLVHILDSFPLFSSYYAFEIFTSAHFSDNDAKNST